MHAQVSSRVVEGKSLARVLVYYHYQLCVCLSSSECSGKTATSLLAYRSDKLSRLSIG